MTAVSTNDILDGARPNGRAPRRSHRRSALTWVAVLAAALVAAPILTLVFSLFTPSSGVMAHLASTILPAAIVNTLALMLFVGIGSIVIGVGTAWLVACCRFPFSRQFEWLLLLPLAMPAYIIGYVYTDLLAFAGPVQSAMRAAFGWSRADYWFPDIQSLWGVSLMLTLVLYPYVYMLARPAFIEQSACIVDASRTLGGGAWETFFRIALPMARPAIAAGAALALMEALADFGTVQYFGVHTFTTVIYRTWFGMGDRIVAAQLCVGLLAFVLALMALERFSRGGRAFARTTRRERHMAAHKLSGFKAGLAILACTAPVMLGFLLPVALLLDMHAHGGDPFFGTRFLTYAGNSVFLAAIAAVLIVGVGALLAAAMRLEPGRWTQGLARFATLGYAIPGTVIAVGVLIPLGQFDNALDGMMRSWFGISTGLLLSGTLTALLFAYLVRFLAVATGSVESGYARISRNMDHAARSLGAGRRELTTAVHAPILRRSLAMAALVVFVDVMKELPATLIVRPFNFDTLAVRVYQLASDERLLQASTASLTIVAIGLLPVILLTRASARG